MTVYVDKLRSYPDGCYPDGWYTNKQARETGRRFGHRWCHLWADTDKEAQVIAQRLSLPGEWMHQPSNGTTHYDLIPPKRVEAMGLGAVEGSGFMNTQRDMMVWQPEAREAVSQAFSANGLRHEFDRYGLAADLWRVVVGFSGIMRSSLGKAMCLSCWDPATGQSVYEIRLSGPLFEVVSVRERRTTAVHEAAHVMAWIIHGGKVAPHGREWRDIMRNVGEEPNRCHTVRPLDAVEAHCACGAVTDLSKRRARMTLEGRSQYCSKCRGLVEIGPKPELGTNGREQLSLFIPTGYRPDTQAAERTLKMEEALASQRKNLKS